MNEEIKSLINEPVEELHIELKSWLDLDTPKHRADLARHICAISNHGGGYIIFGFNNDRTPTTNMPESFALSSDLVASITDKYLDPSIACRVDQVVSDQKYTHWVITVPPHGPTPICAKANGPEIKGKIEGITSGTHYIRKAGPKSIAIITSADWKELIRRCALQDRSAILAAVTAALSGVVPDEKIKKNIDIFEKWNNAAKLAFIESAKQIKSNVPLVECNFQMSYMIDSEDHFELPHKNFEDLLRRVCLEVDQEVNSGWSLFYVFEAALMVPSWRTDLASGLGYKDFLETNLLNENRDLGFDLWRVSTSGLATVVRELWEDTTHLKMTPKTYLNPMLLAMSLLELVRHAEVFSAKFPAPQRIHFFCEWTGIKGRKLYDPQALPFVFGGKTSVENTVRSQGTWPVGKLGNDKAEVAAQLGAKLARAFGWHDFTPAYIRNQKSKWR